MDITAVPKGTWEGDWTPENRVQWHLGNWAIWQRSGGYSHLNMPGRSPIIGISHGADIDQIADACDVSAARAIDAILRDLPRQNRIAFHCEYLGAKWPFPINIELVLPASYSLVAQALNRKGIV